ncbi:MAG: hypothetical protein QNL01_01325 [Akkermansiaceae bacterium]
MTLRSITHAQIFHFDFLLISTNVTPWIKPFSFGDLCGVWAEDVP